MVGPPPGKRHEPLILHIPVEGFSHIRVPVDARLLLFLPPPPPSSSPLETSHVAVDLGPFMASLSASPSLNPLPASPPPPTLRTATFHEPPPSPSLAVELPSSEPPPMPPEAELSPPPSSQPISPEAELPPPTPQQLQSPKPQEPSSSAPKPGTPSKPQSPPLPSSIKQPQLSSTSPSYQPSSPSSPAPSYQKPSPHPSLTPTQLPSTNQPAAKIVDSQQNSFSKSTTSQNIQTPEKSWGFTRQEDLAALTKEVRLAQLLLDKPVNQPGALANYQVLQQNNAINQLKEELKQIYNQMQQIINKNGIINKGELHSFYEKLNIVHKQLEECKATLQNTHPKTELKEFQKNISQNPATAALQMQKNCDLLKETLQNLHREQLQSLTERAKEAFDKGAEGAKSSKEPSAQTTLKPGLLQQETAKSQLGLIAAKESESFSKLSSEINLSQPLQNASELYALSQMLTKTPVPIPTIIPLTLPFEKQIEVKKNKTQESDQEQESGRKISRYGRPKRTQLMALIERGPALIGDPFNEGTKDELPLRTVEMNDFLISVYPITNAQFVDWLQTAWENKTIKLINEKVFSKKHGYLICTTYPTSSFSQIKINVSDGMLSFATLQGTQLHPVVEVSWFGANAYCKEQGVRLPTECEWEKAAGMMPYTHSETLSKFRYGFTKNEIDPSLANYRATLQKVEYNDSSPIGFFNGINVFEKNGKKYPTQNAASPHGCYDMSGNVREWVDEGGKEKITKGGSYATSGIELRVSARTGYNPNMCFPDIGFRVALDLE